LAEALLTSGSGGEYIPDARDALLEPGKADPDGRLDEPIRTTGSTPA
jgi:hypothetical protein